MPSPTSKLIGAADAMWVAPRDLIRKVRDQGPARAEAGCLEIPGAP